MGQIVVGDKRYRLGINPKGWKTLVEYEGRNIKPLSKIPDWLIQHFKANPESRKFPHYISFRDLTPVQAITVFALAKHGGPVRLGINRQGQIASYKLSLSTIQDPEQAGPNATCKFRNVNSATRTGATI